MTTFWFCVHIAAAISLGAAAHRRGRNPIVWTLLTLIPYAIFVTWPLLYILPRRNTEQPASVRLAAGAQIAQAPTNLRLTSDIMGVTVWIVCLIVIGVAIMVRP